MLSSRNLRACSVATRQRPGGSETWWRNATFKPKRSKQRLNRAQRPFGATMASASPSGHTERHEAISAGRITEHGRSGRRTTSLEKKDVNKGRCTVLHFVEGFSFTGNSPRLVVSAHLIRQQRKQKLRPPEVLPLGYKVVRGSFTLPVLLIHQLIFNRCCAMMPSAEVDDPTRNKDGEKKNGGGCGGGEGAQQKWKYGWGTFQKMISEQISVCLSVYLWAEKSAELPKLSILALNCGFVGSLSGNK